MTINRAQLARELEPGLNALFGQEYSTYAKEYEQIFGNLEPSNRAFEEEVMITGFGDAPVKSEGESVTYDNAQETYVARYNHNTLALGFQLTEEAMEDNLYVTLSRRYTKALARSMAHTKNIRGAAVLNNGFDASARIGDGSALYSATHETLSGNQSNTLAVASDLNETSLEQAMIDIADFRDERGLRIAAQGRCLVLPTALQFVAQRILGSTYRSATADNDTNALNDLGYVPEGFKINHFLVDPDAWHVITDVPDGLKGFQRVKMAIGMQGDFDSGNMRYKARERYVFGVSDWRGAYGSPGM